jgi:hypothetical protein
MEKSSKRGKIPQSDWPSIMARYEAGETLSSIARTYDCSPPAISYVVSRSRARQLVGAGSAPVSRAAAEPQLVKSPPAEPTTSNGQGALFSPAPASPLSKEPLSINGLPSPLAATTVFNADRSSDNLPRQTNGLGHNDTSVAPPPMTAPTPSAVPEQAHEPDGDHRRTLHLSLGNGSHESGQTQGPGPQPGDGHYQPYPLPHDHGDRFGRPAAPIQRQGTGVPDYGRPAATPAGSFEPVRGGYPVPPTGNGADRAVPKNGGGPYIDQDLRTRVDLDIAAFLAAFDAALVEDTQESRSTLREATDRLLRAGARTRIELERLEARMPLPRRDAAPHGETGWRQR